MTYALAANSAGVTYQSFNQWMSKGKTEKSGKYSQFYRYIQKRNVCAAKTLLERLNTKAEEGICGFACGYWKDVSVKTLTVLKVKEILFGYGFTSLLNK